MADGNMTPGGSAQGSQHWCTPPEIVELAKLVLHSIALDPFSNPQSVTGAWQQWYGPGADSGSSGYDRSQDGWGEWHPRLYHTVFVNPPWKETQRAIVKCRDEWLRGYDRQVIGLFPTGPNCSSWPIVLRAPARCYPSRRIAFLENGVPKPGNPKDVVIVYWGHDQYRFREVFRELGEVVFG